jgi:hypothetical protein
MATYETQACPLCGAEAEYCRVDAGNRKYFQCPKCSYFQISKRAEKVLSESSSQRRKHYSELSSKAPDDQLFLVIMPTAEFREMSDDILQAEYFPKSELPLDCN